MRWERGRQSGGYEKLRLFEIPQRIDGWLIRYREGAGCDAHRDPVPGRRHYRLNIELRRPRRGGVFQGDVLVRLGRAVLFRPDENVHAVTRVVEGERLVLSLGVAI